MYYLFVIQQNEKILLSGISNDIERTFISIIHKEFRKFNLKFNIEKYIKNHNIVLKLIKIEVEKEKLYEDLLILNKIYKLNNNQNIINLYRKENNHIFEIYKTLNSKDYKLYRYKK